VNIISWAALLGLSLSAFSLGWSFRGSYDAKRAKEREVAK
jgi:hypothetical protein